MVCWKGLAAPEQTSKFKPFQRKKANDLPPSHSRSNTKDRDEAAVIISPQSISDETGLDYSIYLLD